MKALRQYIIQSLVTLVSAQDVESALIEERKRTDIEIEQLEDVWIKNCQFWQAEAAAAAERGQCNERALFKS